MKKKGRGHSLQSEKWPFNAVSWTWILNTEFCFSPWPSLALKGSEFQRYTEVSIVFVSLCFSTHTQTHILISLYICKKFFSRFFFFKIYPFMRWREKERERGREGRYCGRERKGKRVNPKKTPCQAWRQTWGSVPPTQDHDQWRNQKLGAQPTSQCFWPPQYTASQATKRITCVKWKVEWKITRMLTLLRTYSAPGTVSNILYASNNLSLQDNLLPYPSGRCR